jgi:hypothetical protein
MPVIEPVDDKSDDNTLSGAEVAKLVNKYFLEFRNKVNMMFKPELGTIDDMIVTWKNSLVLGKDQQPVASNPEKTTADATAVDAKDESKPIKDGHMHVMICLRTPPDAEGKQSFNTFTVDCTVRFSSDDHPVVAFEEQRKKKAEEVTAVAATTATAAADANTKMVEEEKKTAVVATPEPAAK